MTDCSYVLVTPARNEEDFIEHTIQCMLKQTILPLRWVIVNDGSTDATAAKVRPYLANHPWIMLLDLPVRTERSFAGKVHAFNAGLEQVKDLDYAIIGNLDADVSLVEDQFEFLMNEFVKDSKLGVAGPIFRESGYSSDSDSYEGQAHVAGACQLFRRQCFEDIGGYKPHKAGGIDWMAVTSARMKGWKTQSFRERSIFHHRKLGTAERGRLASSFSYGEKDYYLGGHPVWEMFRVAYRMMKPPYLVDGAALGLGYVCAFLRQIERPVSDELMSFHRREQMRKLKAILSSVVSLKRVDSFQPQRNTQSR
jgi:glycosyltransferase involved in cell wall biosynthesis